jgi:hypothetical protein
MSREELVAANHFYRHLERTLDLSFVLDLVTIMLHKDGSHLGYQTHYVVDGGKSRIILNVSVMAAKNLCAKTVTPEAAYEVWRVRWSS